MARIQRIAPCLWFDDQAEPAATYYTGIFKNSKIVGTARYGEAGQEIHGRQPGSVMVVDFELDGLSFTALNGGPNFKFTEAISLQVNCESQAEVDFYWDRLTAGGDPAAQQCGWLKDKFGLSWQVVPVGMQEMLRHGITPGSERVMAAMMQMKKLDLTALQQAYAG